MGEVTARVEEAVRRLVASGEYGPRDKLPDGSTDAAFHTECREVAMSGGGLHVFGRCGLLVGDLGH